MSSHSGQIKLTFTASLQLYIRFMLSLCQQNGVKHFDVLIQSIDFYSMS